MLKVMHVNEKLSTTVIAHNTGSSELVGESNAALENVAARHCFELQFAKIVKNAFFSNDYIKFKVGFIKLHQARRVGFKLSCKL